MKLMNLERAFALLAVAGMTSAQEHAHTSTCEERTIYRPDLSVPPSPADGGFSIAASFNANVTATQQAIINQAISEWQAVIQTGGSVPNPYPILFQNGPLANPTIALHTKTVGVDGWPLSSLITFDNDGSTNWFVDATPSNDSEFAPGVTPPAGMDYLTVARHEIGHAMGWTSTTALSGLVTGTTFTPNVWNIQMEPGGTNHSDPATFPGDLMVPTATAGVRTALSLYPDTVMVARHYNRSVAMGFIDPDDSGAPFLGTAGNPWSSVTMAWSFAPEGLPLLMTRDTFSPSESYVLDADHTLEVANGSGAGVLDAD